MEEQTCLLCCWTDSQRRPLAIIEWEGRVHAVKKSVCEDHVSKKKKTTRTKIVDGFWDDPQVQSCRFDKFGNGTHLENLEKVHEQPTVIAQSFLASTCGRCIGKSNRKTDLLRLTMTHLIGTQIGHSFA